MSTTEALRVQLDNLKHKIQLQVENKKLKEEHDRQQPVCREATQHVKELEQANDLLAEGRTEVSQLNEELEDLRQRLLESEETKLGTTEELAKYKEQIQ